MKKPCPWGEKSECAAGEIFFKERLDMGAPQAKMFFQRKTRSERAAGENFFQRKTRSKRAAGENFSKNENFIRKNQ